MATYELQAWHATAIWGDEGIAANLEAGCEDTASSLAVYPAHCLRRGQTDESTLPAILVDVPTVTPLRGTWLSTSLADGEAVA